MRFKHKRDAVAHEEKSKVAVRDGKYLVVEDVTIADAARIWMSRVEADGMRHRGPVERATCCNTGNTSICTSCRVSAS